MASDTEIFNAIIALDEQRKELALKRVALELRIRRLNDADRRAVAEIERLNGLLVARQLSTAAGLLPEQIAEDERQAAFDAANAKHPLPISGKN